MVICKRLVVHIKNCVFLLQGLELVRQLFNVSSQSIDSHITVLLNCLDSDDLLLVLGCLFKEFVVAFLHFFAGLAVLVLLDFDFFQLLLKVVLLCLQSVEYGLFRVMVQLELSKFLLNLLQLEVPRFDSLLCFDQLFLHRPDGLAEGVILADEGPNAFFLVLDLRLIFYFRHVKIDHLCLQSAQLLSLSS